jgi:hypothetical protein
MTIDLSSVPSCVFSDGTVIKDRNAAIQYVRNYRVRSPDAGSAQVLHLLENATTPEERERAAQRFRSWIGNLDRDR